MPLDLQVARELDKNLVLIKQSDNYANIVLQLLKSPNCQSWFILKTILQTVQKSDRITYQKLIDYLLRNIQFCMSFSMLLYLHQLKQIYKKYVSSITFRSVYKNIFQSNQQRTLFTSWIESQPTASIVQTTLGLLCQAYPVFYKNQFIQFTEIQLVSIIQWVAYFYAPTAQQYDHICTLSKLPKKSRQLYYTTSQVQKQCAVLKKLIQITSKIPNCSVNVFLFIYPFILSQKQISYFCHLYSTFLLQLQQQNLCNFFICITKSAISSQIVFIINKISLLLKNQDMFYKLKYIYQKYVLVYLARRMKMCKKVQMEVFQVCQFYVLGFIKHCDIGVKGKIHDERIKNKWIRLCEILCLQYPYLTQTTIKMLSQQLSKQHKITCTPTILQSIINNNQYVWQVTIRNIKKLKQYNKIQSKMKGIINNQNQCYMITVIQALQKGVLLWQLLDQAVKLGIDKNGLLQQLYILFAEIEGKAKNNTNKVTVKYLKQRGPEKFRLSLHQQDAYQYLIQLFQMIEKQFSKLPKQLQKFKAIYQIKCKTLTKCNTCNTQKQKQQLSYTYTIPHTQILQKQTTQLVPGYQCDNCDQIRQSILTRILQPSSQILIVHINRFSLTKGIIKKQLSTQVIRRRFEKYRLVGIVCHRGKNMEHGHYVYYHRVGEKRWAVFNDAVVQEFQLEHQDQQFQREFKSQMSPYLLFYQQLKQK